MPPVQPGTRVAGRVVPDQNGAMALNNLESGVVAGAAAGTIVGGLLAKAHGVVALVAGLVVGAVSCAVVGWVYEVAVIVLLSVMGAMWSGLRGRTDATPSDAESKAMTPTASRGVAAGIIVALLVGLRAGWLSALAAAPATALMSAIVAVARGQAR